MGFALRTLRVYLVLAVLSGCASTAYKVATRENSYDFLEARYEEKCSAGLPEPTVGWCPATYVRLVAFKRHLEEANTAVQRGGALPLQMEQIKVDEKGLLGMVKNGRNN